MGTLGLAQATNWASARWWVGHPTIGACGWCGLERSIVTAARHAQGRAGVGYAHQIGKLSHTSHDYGSPRVVGSGSAPSSCSTFFWISITASAWVRRACTRANSCWRRTFSASSGASGADLGPRSWAASPALAPRSRKSRHFDICEVYRPLRRKKAPRSADPRGKVSYSASKASFSVAVQVERLLDGWTSGPRSMIGLWFVIKNLSAPFAHRILGAICLTASGSPETSVLERFALR